MKTKNQFWWIVAALVCPLAPAFAEPPAASQPSGVAMGSPYVDLFHGFGLTPPAGAERGTDRILAQLVSWKMRDAKTNAILWTLTVGKIVNKEAPDDMGDYAKSLAATLKEKENFQVAASEVREIAGHKAVDFKGTTEGKVRWWQRQVQIASGKGNFVLLRMTGPADAADSMDATMTAVLATVKIIDPKEALAQRERNLKAGRNSSRPSLPKNSRRCRPIRAFGFPVAMESSKMAGSPSNPRIRRERAGRLCSGRMCSLSFALTKWPTSS